MRRLLPPARRSWLTTVVGAVLALLTASEPARPFYLAVQRLLNESSESSRTEEEKGEAEKATSSALAARRSLRRHNSLAGRPANHVLPPRLDSHSFSQSLQPAVSQAGELAFRNGVGAPLRC